VLDLPRVPLRGPHDLHRRRTSPDPVQRTYPASHPAEAIDYCLSATGNTVSATVLQAPGSDHLPLLIVAGTGQKET
jgi:endonuclease/exonuclease/phosphatase family metal-dependent hydrolase